MEFIRLFRIQKSRNFILSAISFTDGTRIINYLSQNIINYKVNYWL